MFINKMEMLRQGTPLNMTSYKYDTATSLMFDVTCVNSSGNSSCLPPDLYEHLSYDEIFHYLEEFEKEMFLDLRPLNIVLIVLYSVVFIAGFLGNLSVIVVIIKFKSMRTLTNFFLVNLTIGDLLVIMLCIPVTLGNTVYKKWVYGDVICKLTSFVQGTAVAVSVLSLLAISVSRYFAIYKPLTAKIVFKTRNVRIMLGAIWAVSILSFSPLIFVNSVSKFVYGPYEDIHCKENWATFLDKNIYNLFVFTMLFVAPFLIMVCVYVVIGYTLWIGNQLLFPQYSLSHKDRNYQILRQRRRTVKMLICVVVLFGVCWLPYYVINLWMDFSLNNATITPAMKFVNTYVYPIVLLLGLGNSAVNPICYCLLSNGFKRGFKKMFCYSIFKRGGSFLRTSMRIRSTISESFETVNV